MAYQAPPYPYQRPTHAHAPPPANYQWAPAASSQTFSPTRDGAAPPWQQVPQMVSGMGYPPPSYPAGPMGTEAGAPEMHGHAPMRGPPPPQQMYSQPVPYQNFLQPSPLLGMAFDQGVQAIKSHAGWLDYLSFPRYKYYFTVNNFYVINKFQRLFCAFRYSHWKREEIPHPESLRESIPQPGFNPPTDDPSRKVVYFKPPKDDINAPDLYIPSMAFVTYILLFGLALGVYHRFSPEDLSIIASSALAITFAEIGLIKIGLYLTGTSQPISLLDLMAYCGYKYIGCDVNLLLGILFGYDVYRISTLIVSFLMMIFMLRTFEGLLSPKVVTMHTHRNYFPKFILGLLQLFFCWILGRNAIPAAPVPNS